MTARGRVAAWPAAIRWEALAQHWHCTPGAAREQPEADILIAETYIAAEVAVAGRLAYFRS